MNDMSKVPHLLFRLNLAQRTLMKKFDKEVRDQIGVSATQIAALLYLERHNGCFLVDLSRELFQNKSAITTLVERMEKNKLVIKRPSPNDGRATQIFLTERGKSLASKALPYILTADQELIQDISPQDLNIIVHFLDNLIHRYESGPESFFKETNKKPEVDS